MKRTLFSKLTVALFALVLSLSIAGSAFADEDGDPGGMGDGGTGGGPGGGQVESDDATPETDAGGGFGDWIETLFEALVATIER